MVIGAGAHFYFQHPGGARWAAADLTWRPAVTGVENGSLRECRSSWSRTLRIFPSASLFLLVFLQ